MKRTLLIFMLLVIALVATAPRTSADNPACGNGQQLQACQAVASIDRAICEANGGWFCAIAEADQIKACMFEHGCYHHQ